MEYFGRNEVFFKQRKIYKKEAIVDRYFIKVGPWGSSEEEFNNKLSEKMFLQLNGVAFSKKGKVAMVECLPLDVREQCDQIWRNFATLAKIKKSLANF